MHYEGKNHDKRARNYLQTWSVQQQQTLPMKKETNKVEPQVGAPKPFIGKAEPIPCLGLHHVSDMSRMSQSMASNDSRNSTSRTWLYIDCTFLSNIFKM